MPTVALLDELIISIHALHEESDRRSARQSSRQRISIHALHEESDLGSMWGNLNLPISIHALHEESDTRKIAHGIYRIAFQSTLSMRRATRVSCRPNMGCHFNPRSP